MGGHAVKNVKRIDRYEYDRLIVEIFDLLPELNMYIPPAFSSKTSFGDIDIIVESNDIDRKALIIDRLNPLDEYDNGPCLSVAYKEVQVDFILTKESEYQSTCDYFGRADLGNFIGRVARSLNFKYGHDGLSYDKHYSDHYKISINVSKSMVDILTFLGYNHDVWSKGFDDAESIFKYVTSSPYFNATYFLLDEQAHNDRVRNRKRPMYQNMMAYITDNNLEPKPKLSQEEREVHYHRAIELFGNEFDNEVKAAQLKYDRNKLASGIFNGSIVSEKTGLTGKDLGRLMQLIKSSEKNLTDMVIEGGDAFIDTLLLKYRNMI